MSVKYLKLLSYFDFYSISFMYLFLATSKVNCCLKYYFQGIHVHVVNGVFYTYQI